MFEVFFFWLGFSIVVGVAAHTRERSGVGWFLLALLISPLLAGLIVLALPRSERHPREAHDSPGANKQCPYCAEWIKAEARVCRYCGRDLPTERRTAEPKTAHGPAPLGIGRYTLHEGRTYYMPPNVSDEEAQAYLAGQKASSAQAAEVKPLNALRFLAILAGLGIVIVSIYSLIAGLYGTSRKTASVSGPPVQAEPAASASKAPVQAEPAAEAPAQIAEPSAVIAAPPLQTKPEDKYWVTVDRLNRRTCPSTACGIVGRLFFREGTIVYEQKGGWARISNYYDGACVDGRSEYVDSGNNRCTPDNGIVNGKFAEWVSAEFLSRNRPPDPAAGATGIEALVGQSDDYRIYKAAFVEATKSLISSGRCSKADFREMGGWLKSVNNYKDEPIYFTYCGGSTSANRLYLNAETGEIFR